VNKFNLQARKERKKKREREGERGRTIEFSSSSSSHESGNEEFCFVQLNTRRTGCNHPPKKKKRKERVVLDVMQFGGFPLRLAASTNVCS
jgi:hypothetical protein